MKVTVVLPLDITSKTSFPIKKVVEALNKIQYDDYKILVLTKEPKNLKIYNAEYVKCDYKNIYEAYNKAIDLIRDGYVFFSSTNDLIEPLAFNFIDDKFDIYFYSHKRLDKKKVYIKHCYKNDLISDAVNDHFENTDYLYDKVFNIDFLRKKKITFTLNAKLFNINVLSNINKIKCFKANIVLHSVNMTEGDIDFLNEKTIKTFNQTKNNLKNLYVYDDVVQYIESLKQKVFYSNIDYVFMYVTSDDPKWQKLYKQYVPDEINYATGMQRFRDNDTLKYMLRGLAKNMPWIHKVHMIVMSESQVPDWINRDEVDIITHDEFLPKEQMPCFNSSTLETYFANLPRVSECFIYGNDDMFTFKPQEPTNFFNGQTPIYHINFRNRKKTFVGDQLRIGAYNLIIDENNTRKVAVTQHGLLCFRMSWLKEFFKKYKDKITPVCTRFREPQNYNIWPFALWQFMEKQVQSEKREVLYYEMNGNISQAYNFQKNFADFDCVCINDNEKATPQVRLEVSKKIEKYFPKRCKYEK